MFEIQKQLMLLAVANNYGTGEPAQMHILVRAKIWMYMEIILLAPLDTYT